MCSGEVRPLADCGQRGLRFETQHQLAPGRRGRGMRSRGMQEHHRRRDLTSVRTRHRVPGGHSQLPLVPPPRPRPVRCPRVPIVVLAVPPHTPGVRSRREPPKRRNLSRRVLAPPGAAAVSRSRGASRSSPAGQAVQRPPSPVYTSDIRKDVLDYSNSSCSQVLCGYRRSAWGGVMLVGCVEGPEMDFRATANAGTADRVGSMDEHAASLDEHTFAFKGVRKIGTKFLCFGSVPAKLPLLHWM